MSSEILFVDDEPAILAAFQRSLRKEFKIDTASAAPKRSPCCAAAALMPLS